MISIWSLLDVVTDGLVLFADGVDLRFAERDGGGQNGGGCCDRV
jgi:hypothetical protein